MTLEERERQESFDRLVDSLHEQDKNPLVPKREKNAVSDFTKLRSQPGFRVEHRSRFDPGPWSDVNAIIMKKMNT